MIDARLSECSNRKMLLFLEVKGNYCKLPLISPAACQPCRYPFIHFLEDISNFCYLKFEVK